MKSTVILRIILSLNAILVVSVFFLYRTNSWPFGLESTGCFVSFMLLIVTIFLLWKMNQKLLDSFLKKNIAFGLYLGLLCTIEISINNFIQPGITYRDKIDNTFLFIIEFLIFIVAAREAYQSKEFLSGIKSGIWTGLASGAIACLTALLLIVFGMKYILTDPLNVKEWTDMKATANSSSMDVYFAYQTFTGAIMHLYILGLIFGFVLGTIGGFFGWTIRLLKK
jgi:hypothetical protein